MYACQEGAGREGADRPCPRVLPVTWGAPPRHPAMMAAAHARRAYPSAHHRYAVTSQPGARSRMVCWGGGHLPCLGSQPTSAAVALPRPLCRPPPPHRQCTARPVERHTWASRRGTMRPHTAGGKDTAGLGGRGAPARLATGTDGLRRCRQRIVCHRDHRVCSRVQGASNPDAGRTAPLSPTSHPLSSHSFSE